MRNGNLFSNITMLELFKVLILPMRNGNVVAYSDSTVQKVYSSYPTYEEWKPFTKPSIPCRFFHSSYPTYEEWKHWKSLWTCCSRKLVLILPMRNGNYRPEYYQEVGLESSYPTYEEWKHREIPEFKYLNIPFLSYLWGMETC